MLDEAEKLPHGSTPEGLCICGCGLPTEIAIKTRNGLGQVAGKPKPLLKGHKVPKTALVNPNPTGLCMCGCGEATRVASRTKRNKGIFKGFPLRYIPGHQMRRFGVPPDGYSRCPCCKEMLPVNQFRTKSRCKDCARAQKLARVFGITVEDYRRLYEAQDECCAICGETEKGVHKSGKTFALSVDHDHGSGRIRGLLCGPCNRAIGLMKDNPDLFDKASAYLRKSSA